MIQNARKVCCCRNVGKIKKLKEEIPHGIAVDIIQMNKR